MIQDALASVDAFGPRDRLEAMLVMQIPTLLLAAREAEAAATAEPDFNLRMRRQRHMAMLQRRAEGLSAEVRRHRRSLVTGLDLQHAPPHALGYDLDALEAVWRDPARDLPETALVALPLEIPPGCFGMPLDGRGGEAVPAPVVQPGPDGRLEDRDEFEVEPPPRFQGVPKWKQAGRRYLDELLEEERAELIEAQVLRGETIEEPPQRPAAWTEP
jgi:hypothetical protein